MPEPTHKVFTFYTRRMIHGEESEPKLSRISAYTMWSSATWPGCRVYEVAAKSGTDAKDAARRLRLDEELRRYEHQGGIGGSDAPTS